MKPELLELICCPACQGNMTVSQAQHQDDEIWTGTITCLACHTPFPVHQGMPHLYLDDRDWEPKAKEADGWVSIHKEMGIYTQDEDAVDLKIPYYPEDPWINVARSFDIALQRLALTGNETILDLGAGRGWAAKQFALKGCRVVALDVVPDENVGLGRAKALMTHSHTYFERVIGDGENLPFHPNQFDIVFCGAALHHFSDLDLTLQQIAEVLKPNGRLCAINEPCISVLEEEQVVLERDAAHELELGINENRPNIVGYCRALTTAGLSLESAEPALAANMERSNLLIWAQDLGAIPGTFNWRQLRGSLAKWYVFLKRRVSGWQHRADFLGYRPLFPGEHAQISYNILFWVGSELLLLARKK